MEMEYDSPRVQRCVTPSPLRATPARSRNQLCNLYTSPPRFLLDALEEASHTSVLTDLPKHYLPNFPFRVVNGHSDPTSAQMREIGSHFPGCSGVAYCPPYLVISWPEQQIKPWPLTVGGMPLYYATLDRPHPPTYGKVGRSGPFMKGDAHRLKTWEDPSNTLIEEIAKSLVEKGIGLKLFGWCGVRWYAEVMSTEDGMKLPSAICGLVVMWKVSLEFGESARRAITPMWYSQEYQVIDNTSYKPTLRPGILLESKRGFGTTSGIPLLGSDGKRWFTVAEHGFKLRGNEEVHHPSYVARGDNLIGIVTDNKEYKFVGSDIRLAELEDGMTYSDVSFDADEVDGTKFEGLVRSRDTTIGDRIFMDSPYNGRCEGVLGWRGVNMINPVDHDSPEFTFLHTSMIYFGNGASDILPGTCGSALWTDENKVVALFRWYDQVDAIAYAPSVDVLIEAGYTLEAIP